PLATRQMFWMHWAYSGLCVGLATFSPVSLSTFSAGNQSSNLLHKSRPGGLLLSTCRPTSTPSTWRCVLSLPAMASITPTRYLYCASDAGPLLLTCVLLHHSANLAQSPCSFANTAR